ncbi:MAG: alpha/beta fold hydrolase [Betaproteobacteria bacterium]
MPSVLAGRRVLRPNLRGHAGARSALPAGMREWCDDLVALLDAERAERAVMVGHCLGANIAARFAARYPDRTAGAILIEPMPRDALVGSLGFLKPFRFLFTAAAAAALAFNSVGLKRKKLQPMDLEQWDQAVESGAMKLEDFAAPLSDLRTTPSAGYFASVAAVFEPLPARLACPLLAMISRQSTMTDPARTRSALERLGEVEIVELDAEHWIPTEHPDAMRAAIEAWLARLKVPGKAA